MEPLKNLLQAVDANSSREVFEELLCGGSFKLERIVSTGQATPQGEWYDQDNEEWIVLLTGAARLLFEDDGCEINLSPGDCLNITAHRRHRVQWTDPALQTIWLALHYHPG